MKAIELQEYLRSLDAGWIDRQQTVDTFKAGDPRGRNPRNCRWLDELHLGVGKSSGAGL